MLPGRAPLLVPSVQVPPKRTLYSVQTHPRMPVVVDHFSALILAPKQTARSHLMSAQSGWIVVRTRFRPRVRTYLRTFFFNSKKSQKKTFTSVSRRNRRRRCGNLSWAKILKSSTNHARSNDLLHNPLRTAFLRSKLRY